MLSSKLIQLIEDHWASITDRIIRQIRSDPRLPHVAALPEGELRDRAEDIVKHLGHWLTLAREEELTRRFERLGRKRFEEQVPLHEVVLSHLFIKDASVEFVREQGIGHTTVDVYAEEELEHSTGRFFDSMIYHIVRGYEEALDAAQARPGAQKRQAAKA